MKTGFKANKVWWLLVWALWLGLSQMALAQFSHYRTEVFKGTNSQSAFLEFAPGTPALPPDYFKKITQEQAMDIVTSGVPDHIRYRSQGERKLSDSYMALLNYYGQTEGMGESQSGTNLSWAAEYPSDDWYGAELAASEFTIINSYTEYTNKLSKTEYKAWRHYPDEDNNPTGDLVTTYKLDEKFRWEEVVSAAMNAASNYVENSYIAASPFAYSQLSFTTNYNLSYLVNNLPTPNSLAAETRGFILTAEYEGSVEGQTYEVAMEVEHNISWYEKGGLMRTNFVEKVKTKRTATGRVLQWTKTCLAPDLLMPTNYHSMQYRNIRITPVCKDCQTGAGSGTKKDGCLELGFSLGGGAAQSYVGSLEVYQIYPSPVIFSPESLSFSGSADLVTINRDDQGFISSVAAPLTYVQVVATNQYKYELKFYDFDGTNYLTNASPYVIWLVEDPDLGRNNFQRAKVSEIRGAHVNVSLFEWSATLGDWTLSEGGLTKTIKYTSDDIPGVEWTHYEHITSPSSKQVFRETSQTLHQYSWGTAVIREALGGTNGLHVANYGYDIYGNLTSVERSSGEWERLQYDTNHRVIKVFGTRQNAGPNTNLTYYATGYGYEKVTAADTSTNLSDVPRTIIQYIGSGGTSTEMSRMYMVYATNYTQTIICQTPGAAASDANNLVTTTVYSNEEGFKGRVANIQYPDGKLTVFEYERDEDGLLKTTVWSGEGEINGVGTNVVDGIKTEVITGLSDEVLSVTSTDIVSEIVVASEVYSEFDYQRRPRKVTFLDGTSKTMQYSCCTLDSETDANGITTSYTYDALKRLTSVTRAGASLIYQYDPADRLIALFRQGTDGSVMLLQTNRFNQADELLTVKNGLGETTSFNYSTNGYGAILRTTGFPDYTTRYDTYYRDGRIWSVTGSGVAGMVYEYGVDSALGTNQPYIQERHLNVSGAAVDEWTKTYLDGALRPEKILYPDDAVSQIIYNKGHLSRTIDPDGVSRMWIFNKKGEMEYVAQDVDQNGVVDFDAYDRVVQTKTYVTNAHGVSVIRNERWVWATNGVTTPTLISTMDMSVSTREAWQFAFGQTNYSVQVCLTNGICYVTNIASDRSYTVSLAQTGLLSSVTAYSSNGVQLAQVSYGYDAHLRVKTVTDSRSGTSTNAYDALDRLTAFTTPSPGGGQSPQTTHVAYDKVGHVKQVTEPDGGVVINEYYPMGWLKRRYGSRTYPVEYEYDAVGRVVTQKTWKNFENGEGAAVTTWNYDAERGFLVSKRYADGKGPDFEYSAAGRLTKRTWARGTETDYTYNGAGDLQEIDYSDSTPFMAYGYDRLGRTLWTMSGFTNDVVTNYYTVEGLWSVEQHAIGYLGGISVTNSYDSLLRRSGFSVKSNATALFSTGYDYDAASRLATVTSGLSSAGYDYLANAGLISGVTLQQNGTTRQVTSRAYDLLDRLTNITSTASAFTNAFTYLYNDVNQRTKVTREDGSYWNYGYDELGQLTGAKRFWGDNTAVKGQQFGYAFDEIGNRESSVRNGKPSSRTTRYEVNNINQYGVRSVPGLVDVLGMAHTNATVTVNGVKAERKGEYFHAEMGFTNRVQTVYAGLTNIAVLNDGSNPDIVLTNTGKVFLPSTPERLVYDDDGNLTGDGRWTYTWDAENRLIQMEATSAAYGAGAPRQKLQFAYDAGGRRIQKVVSLWNGSAYVGQYTNRFVYSGWNLAAEFKVGSSLKLERSYVWGKDLSGTLQGAGGVGGLLALNTYTNGTLSGTHFASYDGSGNLSALINAADGSESARYEYGPFGEPIRVTGSLASQNPFRFSTKYEDNETGYLYYGYRYYNANTGTWISRDPLGELGGMNLYGFVGNEPTGYYDFLGLADDPTSWWYWFRNSDSPQWVDRHGNIQTSNPPSQKLPLPPLTDEQKYSYGANHGIVSNPYCYGNKASDLITKGIPEYVGKTAVQVVGGEEQLALEGVVKVGGMWFRMAKVAAPLEQAVVTELKTGAQVEKSAVLAEQQTVNMVKKGESAAKNANQTCPIVTKAEERVYVHLDASGNVNYIGITDDLMRRAAEHKIDPSKIGEIMKPLTGKLTHDQARTIEAMLIRDRLRVARSKKLIDGTEPVMEQLQKSGLLNKNRGRDPDRWLNLDPDDFVKNFSESFDIRTPQGK